MRALFLVVALVVLLPALVGCGSGEPQVPPFEAGRNIAVLDGVMLGTGATEHAQLRKTLRVKVDNPLAALEVETAWALRPRTIDQSTLLIIQVTNVGDLPQCLIEVDGLTFVDESNQPLEPAEQSWVFGSVGDVGRPGQPLYTDTCLGVDETGYILHVLSYERVANAYDRVAEARFGWTLHAHNPVTTPEPIVKASRYDRLTDGSVRVHFDNSGTRAADLTHHFTRVMLFDDGGSPLWWGFAVDAFAPSDFLLPPGESGSADETDTFKLYAGSGSRLKVFINFEAPPSGSALQAAGDVERDVRTLLRVRAAQQKSSLPLGER